MPLLRCLIPATSEKMIKLPEIPQNEKFLLDMIQPDLYTGPWIAGGAVLRWLDQKPLDNHDLDVFCRTSEQYLNISEKLSTLFAMHIITDSSISCIRQHDSANAVTWKITKDNTSRNVQVIKRPRLMLSELFGAFDIRVCRMATDGVGVIAAPGAWEDFQNRQITVNLPAHTHCIQRIVKYMCYGYNPSWDVLQHIIDSDDYSDTGTNDEYIKI
jgi:hypothetical protein